MNAHFIRTNDTLFAVADVGVPEMVDGHGFTCACGKAATITAVAMERNATTFFFCGDLACLT